MNLNALTAIKKSKTMGLPLRACERSHFVCQGGGSPILLGGSMTHLDAPVWEKVLDDIRRDFTPREAEDDKDKIWNEVCHIVWDKLAHLQYTYIKEADDSISAMADSEGVGFSEQDLADFAHKHWNPKISQCSYCGTIMNEEFFKKHHLLSECQANRKHNQERNKQEARAEEEYQRQKEENAHL